MGQSHAVAIGGPGGCVPTLRKYLRRDHERFALANQRCKSVDRALVHFVIRLNATKENVGVYEYAH